MPSRETPTDNPDTDVCTCGDVRDEHHHPDYPASTACECEGCSCIAFEFDHPEEP
jgi:hypothetical protein